MPIDIGKYNQYFDIDEKYWPCIDDSAIDAGAPWKNTFPHKAFVDLLNQTEKMLGGTTKKSIWIHGSYGTGKSQCAHALKKILESSNEELEEYWNSYDSLKANPGLLTKLEGHKSRGILTAYRYASGGINTPRDFFFAIQETLKNALGESNLEYKGENSLKESVIAWLEDKTHADFFDALLKKPEWNSKFSQSNADEVLNTLRKDGSVKKLMENVFDLADKEGITAMSLDADKLKNWIRDIVVTNDIKIVFVWDEFSKFFSQNKNSIDEFQKVVALCQEVPFYLVIVTHQTSEVDLSDTSWSVAKQRFEFCEITLPDNVAFDLIGHAFSVKPAAKEAWNVLFQDLNDMIETSRTKVMSAAGVYDPMALKKIMPIHPMTAFVLKNIATSFKANQRSMFDFVKTKDTEKYHAFQWFIQNTSADDDYPLLTVDMLWNFFYENGKDDLSSDVRAILDAYSQQGGLTAKEQMVLKAILIMQAVDKKNAGVIDLLKPTEQNISYVFEGVSSGLDTECKNIAKGLAEKGILIRNPIGDGKFAYGAAVLSGDQSKIDKFKEEIRKETNTAGLVSFGNLSSVLNLSPALKLRFESTPGSGTIIPVTLNDFKKEIDRIKNIQSNWHFNAIIAFAMNDNEASEFRKLIRETIKNEEYKGITIIDTLDSTLSEEEFKQYVEYAAMARYYQGNNNQSSKENDNKAKQIISYTWRNKIYNGSFYVYSVLSPDGEKMNGGSSVSSTLQAIVSSKFKYSFDFCRGITETEMKLTQGKASAKCGIVKKTEKAVVNAEKSVFPREWAIDEYWNDESTSSSNISVIKKDIDNLIKSKFDEHGQISIGDICDHLEVKYGFAPCNLTAFIVGFILREYRGEPYRYRDEKGSHDAMNPDKLAEMIGNYIGKEPEPAFILKMTPEEKAFYEVTEKAWGFEPSTYSSVDQAAVGIKNKMQAFGLPVWCLEDVDTFGVYDIISKYIELVQSEGSTAHEIATNIIGKAYIVRESLGDNLAKLLTSDNCQKGMISFLKSFDEGKAYKLAKEIGATDNILKDVSNLFSVSYSSLWNKETGKEEIEKLTVEYSFVKETNIILNSDAHSKNEAFEKWIEKLNFVICSCEALQSKYPEISTVFEFLALIYSKSEILPDRFSTYTEKLIAKSVEVRHYLDNEAETFMQVYSAYLDDVSVEDVGDLKPRLFGIFKKSKTESNSTVKEAADEFRKGKLKTQMFALWKEKTGSKSPADWSFKHRTPILILVCQNEYSRATKAFETLNKTTSTEKEIQNALEYLNEASFYRDIADEETVEAAFRSMLGSYSKLLPDSEKIRDAFEELSIETYEWNTHPQIKAKIKELAEAEYYAGGSDNVASMIKSWGTEKLQDKLIAMIQDNINLGIEIMNEGE